MSRIFWKVDVGNEELNYGEKDWQRAHDLGLRLAGHKTRDKIGMLMR